jgi:hypothetical protein
MWQDIVFTVAATGLNLAILPTLRSENKPPLLTSVGYCVCVTTMGGALLAVPLWFSGVTNIIGGLLWGMVAITTLRSQGGRKWNTTAAWFK